MTIATLRRSLRVDCAESRFAAPFRISGYVFHSMPSVLATIGERGTDGGIGGAIEGRGEAAGVYFLGDDQERMVADIESVRAFIEAGITRHELQAVLPPGGARNALDCALWELEARLTRTPVWALAGLPPPVSKVTTFTLSADEPAVVHERAKELGFARAIKLKLDGDVDVDRARLTAVRSVRPDVWLSADANQGFGAADLDALEQMLVEHHVAMVEQPVPRGEEQILDGWRPPLPVAADESILDLAELHDKAHAFDIINIKLDKCGGLTEGLAMARVARAMGKQLMVGNMGGSTLAMAPGFALAQLCDFVDLDGPWGLVDDPLSGQIYADGEINVPQSLWGFADAG